MFRNPLEERGGRVCNARNTFFNKKIITAHYVPTTCARTMLVQEWKRDKIRIGCLTPAF